MVPEGRLIAEGLVDLRNNPTVGLAPRLNQNMRFAD